MRVRGEYLAELFLGFCREPSASETNHDAGRFACRFVVQDVLGKFHSSSGFGDAKRLQGLFVHPDGVIVVGHQERRPVAGQSRKVLLGGKGAIRKRRIIPAVHFDPLQVRPLVRVRFDLLLNLLQRAARNAGDIRVIAQTQMKMAVDKSR